MAKCDEGYLCDVCGKPVDEITESELYLRFVLREVQLEELHVTPERHIECNPVQAQFIVDERFAAPKVEGMFDKRMLEDDEVKRMERRVTAAFRRLHDVTGSGLPVEDYPLAAAELKEIDDTPSGR